MTPLPPRQATHPLLLEFQVPIGLMCVAALYHPQMVFLPVHGVGPHSIRHSDKWSDGQSLIIGKSPHPFQPPIVRLMWVQAVVSPLHLLLSRALQVGAGAQQSFHAPVTCRCVRGALCGLCRCLPHTHVLECSQLCDAVPM